MPSKSKRQPADRDRALKALALRKQGLPYREIAGRLGWGDESSARYAVTKLLDRTEAEEVAELRQIEGERLDALQLTHWKAALAGDMEAGRMVLKVMERRARLFGMDAPAKVAVEQLTSVQFAERFVTLVGSMDSAMLADAIADLPGGPAVAIDLMRDVLLSGAGQGDGRATPTRTVDALPVGDGITEAVPPSYEAYSGPQADSGDDADGEPWSNL